MKVKITRTLNEDDNGYPGLVIESGTILDVLAFEEDGRVTVGLDTPDGNELWFLVNPADYEQVEG